jgi:phage major head subunit gpT-like protein
MKKIFAQTFGVIGMIVMLLISSFVPALAESGKSIGSGYGFTLFGTFVVGMVVNIANLQGLFTTWKTVFNKFYAETTPQYTKVAMVVPSTGKVEVHAWLGAFPAMREWLGDRVVRNLKSYKWQIENKDWESTVKVPRNDIEDDTYGLFTNLMQSMGASAKEHPDDLVFDLFNDGFAASCYDGKTFFATNHEFGSNKGTGALTPTNYGAALAAVRRMKDDQGKYLYNGSEKLSLWTGPELHDTAKKIVQNEFVSVANGSTENNIHKGTATAEFSPKITSTTAWFIVIEKNGMKPFIFQERKKPQFTALTNVDDENVFKRKEFLFGADSRDNAGFGLPQLCWGSTGAG